MSTYLGLKWTTSRGRDTYGYNVVTLTDEQTGKRYRAMGGGYDMVGTVFGEWLQDTHQAELVQWAERVGHDEGTRSGVTDHYGAFYLPASEHKPLAARVVLDGGCGLESMLRIARTLGIEVTRTYKQTGRNRGETTGWLIG